MPLCSIPPGANITCLYCMQCFVWPYCQACLYALCSPRCHGGHTCKVLEDLAQHDDVLMDMDEQSVRRFPDIHLIQWDLKNNTKAASPLVAYCCSELSSPEDIKYCGSTMWESVHSPSGPEHFLHKQWLPPAVGVDFLIRHSRCSVQMPYVPHESQIFRPNTNVSARIPDLS